MTPPRCRSTWKTRKAWTTSRRTTPPPTWTKPNNTGSWSSSLRALPEFTTMTLLVVGSGGREHALAWRLAQSPRVQTVYVAPGNGGTARAERIKNLDITDIQELIAFVQQEKIAFTVVGPEAPLAAGIVDAFRSAGLKIFGPTQTAAQLESSKDYAKAFMVRHKIPTAAYQTFTDPEAAKDYIRQQGAPIVVKADGLAAGKGVIVATTLEEALGAIDDILGDGR